MLQFSEKVDDPDNIDQIISLPSSLINNILQRLPIRDLIRTSILSKKWKCMWVSTTQLEFDIDFFKTCRHLECRRISNIITKILWLHNDPIYKFSLHIPFDYPTKMVWLKRWIQLLSTKGITNLQIVNLQTDPFPIPSYLFYCRELTSLELHNFELSIMPNFDGFKSLVVLRLFDIHFESSALESLLFGCQSLVELTITDCFGFKHINISIPTLKVLCIEGGEMIKSICLKQGQNLIDLTLLADKPGDNFKKRRLSDIIKGLPMIERLRLDTSYIKFLSAGINPQVLPKSVDALKYLELDGVNFNEVRSILFIISLIESSPNLEELAIKSLSMDVGSRQILNNFDNVNCCLNQLQIVNIIVKADYKNALDLVRFLLAKSASLKILTFKLGLGLNQSDGRILLNISCDLLHMRRASARAKVTFLYDIK